MLYGCLDNETCSCDGRRYFSVTNSPAVHLGDIKGPFAWRGWRQARSGWVLASRTYRRLEIRLRLMVCSSVSLFLSLFFSLSSSPSVLISFDFFFFFTFVDLIFRFFSLFFPFRFLSGFSISLGLSSLSSSSFLRCFDQVILYHFGLSLIFIPLLLLF